VPRREHGRRRYVCRRCGFTYYGNPVPAAVAVLEHRGDVLFARRAAPPYAGTWDLPGGFLEAGETPERALRRELREEIGARVGRLRLLGFYPDRYGSRGFPVLTVAYRARLARRPLRPADDVSEVRWFPARRLPMRAIAFASVQAALRDWLRQSEGASTAPSETSPRTGLRRPRRRSNGSQPDTGLRGR
jgi:ADP-ribose pyrophosphatase YjhB (NUDIX family)